MKNSKINKNDIVLKILFISIFIVMIIGTSFAYFAVQTSQVYNNITIETAELGTAVAEGTSVSLYVTKNDMKIENGSNLYTAYKESNDDALLSIKTSTGNSLKMECTYDLIYNPAKVYNKSSENINNYKEFTIIGEQELRNGPSNTLVSGSMGEIDLTGVSTIITIVSGAKLIIPEAKANAEVVWKIKPRYYNLAIDQTDNMNITFGGTIEVERLVCVSF